MASTMTGALRAAGPEVRRGEIVARAETAGLRLVRFLYCDNDGIIRGKSTGIAGLKDRLETGIGLTVAMQAFTMLDHLATVEGMGPVGEIRLVPDPDTFVIAPYAPHTGVLLVDMETLDGKPYAADGRAFLRRAVERAAKHDLEIVAAFEPEWSLARKVDGAFVPLDDSGCFTTTGMDVAQDVIDEIVTAMEAQGLTVEQYYAELGWGQQELSIRHAPALQAADRHLLYRETVRGVALKHGLYASFAPKPWADQAGNGCHLHFSGWNRERTVNRFHDPNAPYMLSELGKQFMAGILEHLPALVALTCASVNSYRRLQPQMWASAYRVWGPDNREGALRVASTFRGREAESINIELKSSDSSANPYVALGGVIAAGLDGIQRRLQLPPPVTVDPHTMDEKARQAVGGDRLPQSLKEAVGNLKRDRVLMEALGDRLATSYIAVKELDIDAFAGADEAFEFRQHIYKF
jgi:glutamine synthetase